MCIVKKIPFGHFSDNNIKQKTHLYNITNNANYTLSLCDYGATIIGFTTPQGYDCIVGDKSLEYFTQDITPYFGATVGRLAGRTDPGTFAIDDKNYNLAANEGLTAHLHGGHRALNKKMWLAEQHNTPDSTGIRFTLVSPDDENGYPGTLTLQTDILLKNDEPTIVIEYKVTSFSKTPVNLTNHSYFRLEADTIKNHTIQIFSNEVYRFDKNALVTGEVIAVENTPWDLQNPTLLEKPIQNFMDDKKGIDYIWKIFDTTIQRTPISFNSFKNTSKFTLYKAATLTSPSGNTLTTYTSCPALVCYTGNHLGQYTTGERHYNSYEAICFETQYCPGYLHIPSLRQSFVSPDHTWKEKTEYRFSFV